MTIYNDAIKYCEEWCGKLSQEQKAVLRTKLGYFQGVGRAVGSMHWYPLIRLNKQSLDIIDSQGYLQKASTQGATMYPFAPGMYPISKESSLSERPEEEKLDKC